MGRSLQRATRLRPNYLAAAVAQRWPWALQVATDSQGLTWRGPGGPGSWLRHLWHNQDARSHPCPIPAPSLPLRWAGTPCPSVSTGQDSEWPFRPLLLQEVRTRQHARRPGAPVSGMFWEAAACSRGCSWCPGARRCLGTVITVCSADDPFQETTPDACSSTVRLPGARRGPGPPCRPA